MRGTVRVGFLIVFCIAMCTLGLSPHSQAASQTVVIRSVLAADTIDTNDELIELENQSPLPVDITNWSLVYISSTNSYSSLMTLRSSTPGAHIMLPAGARETVFSTKYIANHPTTNGYIGAERFTGKMGYTTAGLELRDDADSPIDTVRWGSAWAANVDATPAVSMSNTTLLQRVGADTDNNKNDFRSLAQAGQLFSYGQLYELVDQCANIDGLQAELPSDMKKDSLGNCVTVDTCPNLEGIQLDVPAGMELYKGRCEELFIPANLSITELLPNPSGVDTGNEYIELYNASENDVVLDDYFIDIAGKRIMFPAGESIPSHSYRSFSDAELGLVLANTKGIALTLMSRNLIKVDSSVAYANAPIDMAWAWVNDSWQYTNQLTPGAVNSASIIDDGQVPTPDSGVVACANGYYRNPLTNRCNKIKVDEVPVACKPTQYRSEETGRCRNYVTIATPAACKEGQYRSEETGRCRSIAAAASLKPCDDDQFRNPATGRCKQIASTDDLPKPCASGYERNPETNRCRKIQTSSMPLAAFPVEPIKPSSNTMGIWLTAGGVVACGLVYAGWEWRRELAGAARRIIGHLGRK